jgi:hypothetical protein
MLRHSYLAVLIAGTLAGVTATAVVPKPRKPVMVTGSWSVKSEVYVTGGGGLLDHSDSDASWSFYDWEFREATASYDVLYNCGTREEKEYQLKLDTGHEPAWFDLINNDKVELGILQRDGKNLVWLRGPSVPLREWKKMKGNCALRPRAFKLDPKQVGTSLLVLKPGM